jgi:2-alkenal reductase
MRPSLVAVVALVAAFVGGSGALLLGKATGWTDGDGETIVEQVAGGAAALPAAETETDARGDAVRPLLGNEFDPGRIYRERAGGVVTVYALFEGHGEEGAEGAAQGSGFVVSRDGYVLTNSHVISTAGQDPSDGDLDGDDSRAGTRPASRVYVEFRDGDRAEASIVGWDIFDDVGVIKVDPRAHSLRPIPLGDSSRVQVGEPVVAIGSPFGHAGSITAGIVAATERSVESLTSDYRLVDAIQTDAPINRGNSGGPLIDARGFAIGINAQINSETGIAEGVGFAVPINAAVRSMEQLIATGEVRYAWAGISARTVTPGLARRFELPAARGAAIQRVVSESPAQAAGLRAGTDVREFAGARIEVDGDLIVAIDGEPVQDADDVVRAITARRPGERVRFTVLRGERRLAITVELGERPSERPGPDR